MIRRFVRYVRGALVRKLVTVVVAVHVLLTLVLVEELVRKQEDLLHARLIARAQSNVTLLRESVLPQVRGYDLIALDDLLQRSRRLPDVDSIEVLAEDGTVLGHTDPSKVGKRAVDPRIRRLLTTPIEDNGEQSIILQDSTDLIEAGAPLGMVGRRLGAVRITLGTRNTLNMARAMTMRAIAFGLVAIVAGAFIISMVARRISRRLTRLMRSVDAYLNGEKAEPGLDLSPDEVGRLAQVLSQFMGEITANRQRILADRDHLEVLVKERTEELHNAANQAIESKLFVEKIIANSPYGVAVADSSGRFVLVNQVALTMFEMPELGLSQGSLDDIAFFGDPTVAAAVSTARKADQTTTCNVERSRPKGAIQTLHCSFTPFESQGLQFLLCKLQDISRDKAYERDLEQARQELETIIDNVPGLVFYRDTESRFVRVNQYMAATLGRSKHKIEGQTIDALFPSDVAETHRLEDLAITRNNKGLLNVEAPWMTVQGERWFLTSKVPITGESGIAKGILGISIDVTDRKVAELRLAEVTSRFSALFLQTQEGISFADLQGRYVMVNPAFCSMLGYSESELLALKVRDVTVPHATSSIFEQLVKEGGSNATERQLRRKDGTTFWAQISGSRISVGNQDFVQGLVRDISEHKQAESLLLENEERFRAIFTSSPDPYLVIDAHLGEIQNCNPATERILGLGWSEILGKTIGELSPEYQHDGQVSFVAFAGHLQVAREKGHDRFEWLVNRSDDVNLWVDINASAVVMNGRPLILLVWRDITGHKTLEENLQRSNQELEQFAYVASHDLQEPLRMVASYTELLSERYKGKLDERADKFIEYAVDGAKRMQGLISDLLLFSRVGNVTEARELVPAEAAFTDAMANLQFALRDSNGIVTHSDLPTVKAARTQLVLLFQNLIGNAMKFRGDATPTVHVSAEAKGGEWTFCVRDNGIGIDPRFTDRIFRVFQRLHERGRYPGSGIGLAICKKIVTRHGGRIWVESQPGEGAAFFFTWPMQSLAADETAVSEA